MFAFLLKGLLRDKRRSLLPVLVVTIGVFVVVAMTGMMSGMLNSSLNMTADFQTGHVRVMTRAYALDQDKKPNDLAILDADNLVAELRELFPDLDWVTRINFGGLLDIPDANGETKAQGPVGGQAFDLLGPASREAARLDLEKALVVGQLIHKPGQILVSADYAERFDVKPGDTVTFFGSTMYGSMSFMNFEVAGVLRFGLAILDKGAIIIDLADARLLLDMEDAAGEILGFLPGGFAPERAAQIKQTFNALYADDPDPYAPVMEQLLDDQTLHQMMEYSNYISSIMLVLLVLALALVLWNAGILSGIRRFREFGVRLALGESKHKIFSSLLLEALAVGVVGSVLGTLLGLGLSWLLMIYGIDYSAAMENVSMMIDPVVRSEITPNMLWIGFIPGVLAILLGTALSGREIYRRSTANLFKELE